MRNLLWLPILGGLIITSLSAATVQYTVTQIGNPSLSEFQYTYYLDPSLLSPTNAINETIEIYFDSTYYSNLTNAVADPTSDWTVFALGAIPGQPGEYYLSPNKNNPSMSGPFTVDFTYTGTQQQPTPGSQSFAVNLYTGGNFDGAVLTGTTSLYQATDPVPEPRAVSLGALGMLLVCIAVSVRRRATRVTV